MKGNSVARRKLTTGERGWIGLVFYIIAMDSIAWINQVRGRRKDETMSVSWGRWLQHPRARYATGLAWSTISLHLFLSWPLPGEKTLKKVVQGTFRKRSINGALTNGKLQMKKLRAYKVPKKSNTVES